MNLVSCLITAIILSTSAAISHGVYRGDDKTLLVIVLSDNSSEQTSWRSPLESLGQGFDPESHSSKNFSEHQQNHNHHLASPLIEHLQYFVNEAGFKSTRFEDQSEFLRSELSHLSSSVNPSSQQSIHECNFANNMFTEMVDSVKNLNIYSQNGAEQVLVRKIINLNISLFGFYDSHGVPDPQIKGYESSLTRINSALSIWQGIFDDLDAVQEDLRSVFDKHLRAARSKLSDLAKYINHGSA
ncbi:hypothetical protein JCM33374_g1948 [Metschnikowia sp. JCM 33374]|nr:hypothetical protein JCM33374_g1948 [Metschnikowia sp. JCM 33374]